MKNTADGLFGGWPDRLVVVGKDGKISYKSEAGPRGFSDAVRKGAFEKALKAATK